MNSKLSSNKNNKNSHSKPLVISKILKSTRKTLMYLILQTLKKLPKRNYRTSPLSLRNSLARN